MIEDFFSRKLKVSQEPVFIVGFPRSGTTLLQTLLITQSEFVSFPETHFFLLLTPLISVNEFGIIRNSIVKEVYDKISLKTDVEFSSIEKNYINEKIRRQQLDIKLFFELIILKCIAKYNDDINSVNLRWIEKTPYHGMSVHKIYKFFPYAKVVHIVRDPLKAIISRKKNFSDDQQFSYEDLANHWVEFISKMERFEAQFKDRVYTIRYEDLTEKTTDVLARILEFLGEGFDEKKLSGYKDEAEKVILDWEFWKIDNKKSEISNMNLKYNNINLDDPELRKALKVLENKRKSYYDK